MNTYGVKTPSPPILRLRNATQTSLVLEWDPIDLATASLKSLSLYRNGSKAGSIPRPLETRSTKISGLAVHAEYTFHLVLRTTAGTYQSEKLTCRTHKMTDLSGITVTSGVLPPQQKDALAAALDRIGGKLIDTVRIDTTHFVCTEGRGPLWEKAVEMNIPVVVPEWVDACEAEGTIVSVRGYYLNADPKARQLGPIHGSTQHQRTTSSATSIQPPQTPTQQTGSQSRMSLAPRASRERESHTIGEPPITPFPGANMSGQPTAAEDEIDSDDDQSPPPAPPPKDEPEESDEPSPNGPTAQIVVTEPTSPSKDQQSKDEDHEQENDQGRESEKSKGTAAADAGNDQDAQAGDDASSNGPTKGKGKEGEGDFNEVPL